MNIWRLFPLVTAAQWIIKWYPAGKTSTDSRLNLPGKWAWLTMEAPAFITLLYIMRTLPKELNLSFLPWQNWAMAGLYTAHYIYRAIIFPLINPSMSPIHPLVWLMAAGFNVTNALAIGGWLAGHGPVTMSYWDGRGSYVPLGMALWALGLMGNMYHDDQLREIRRKAKRKQQKQQQEVDKQQQEANKPSRGVDKVYMIPENGLFSFILYPHYLCEWIEWSGFWLAGGRAFTPARTFLLNEITTMLPRALQGKQWYIDKFGKEAVGARGAIIPGLL